MSVIPTITGATRGLRRAFGGKAPDFPESPQFTQEGFVNRLPGVVLEPGENSSMAADLVRRRNAGAARRNIPVLRPDFPERAGDLVATWLGHSSVLIEIGGRRVLTDPVFSERVSPSPTVGPRRTHPSPVTAEDLPALDAVLISHDHYDHLDMATIDALAPTGVAFVVPLGNGAHLRTWGVPEAQIHELDWDGSVDLDGLVLSCTEARHFSGRLFKRNLTLWSSWAITLGERSVFFGGDTGYTPAFKEIGERFGGFDVTVLPIGAYDKRWRDIHMDPQEAVQTHLEVHGKVLLPVHWGTFNLAFHEWDAPVEWLLREAAEHEVTLALPRVGERVDLREGRPPAEPWWRQA